jgi:hypothetical protein
MTETEEITKVMQELRQQEGVDFQKIQTDNLNRFLTREFNRVVLPNWLLLIFMEGGIISTLLGLSLYFNHPVLLIGGGLVQAVPSAYFILRRFRNEDNRK